MLAEALGPAAHVTFALEGTPVDESRLGSGLAKDAEEEVGRLGHGTAIEGTAIFPPRRHYSPNEPIQIHVDPIRMHFFDLDSGLALR